jgi:hypothetical protein
MICFTLNCSSQHEFEGWFRDNAAFERQAEAGHVVCPVCGDKAVRKAIMAPAVSRSREPGAPSEAQRRTATMLKMMREVREHVVQNFEHVGEQFADEARRIHQGEATGRGIWGQATAAEAKALSEEGIPVGRLPDPPELDG